MDPKLAKKLSDYGATFVFMDFPTGSEFGVDCCMWTVGPKFKGVKMIPPGVHFVYFSAVSSSEGLDVGPRNGFFHDFKPGEMMVRFWDHQRETLSDRRASQEDLSRMKADKNGLDPFLAPYSYDHHKKWISLTNYATAELTQRLSPVSGVVSSFCELVALEKFEQKNTHRKNKMQTDAEQISKSSSNEKVVERPQRNDEDTLPKMSAESQMRFHEIPKNLIPPGASASEVTRFSLDKTLLLDILLKSDFAERESDLLGELQLAFVVFIYGRVYDGFEQWKRLVHLLCCAASSATSRLQLFNDFITVLYFQIQEIPDDFFVDIITCSNFLTSTLCSFFQNLLSEECDSDLKLKAEKFRAYLTKRFKWNFDEDDVEDERPVVVELSEKQKKLMDL